MPKNVRVIIITGGGFGVGAAAARRLVAAGHRVSVIVESLAARGAVAQPAGADCFFTNFTKFSEVRALAQELLERYPHIDVLAHTAGGVFDGERQVTPDGHEITFQVNFLSGYLLTRLLLERLLQSRATVICTSDGGRGLQAEVDLDDLESARDYDAIKAYGCSRRAQFLFVRELHRRYGHAGLASAAFHPGNIVYGFPRQPDTRGLAAGRSSRRYLWLTAPEEGAKTLVFLAQGRPGVDFPSGEYFYRDTPTTPNWHVCSNRLGLAFWARCDRMIEPFVSAT